LFTTHPPHGFVVCTFFLFWVGIDLQTNTCSMLDWRKSWRWKNTEPIMEARVTINKKAKANSSLPEQDGTVVTHFFYQIMDSKRIIYYSTTFFFFFS
jgi:hypothetical protein